MHFVINKKYGSNPASVYIKRDITLGFSEGQDFTQHSKNNDPFRKEMKGM